MSRFARVGGRAGLGIDIASNQSADMFTQMRLALQTERAHANAKLARRGLFPATLVLNASDVLRAATIDGANALGLADEVGSLAVGKRVFLNPEVRKSHRMRTALAAANFDPFSYRLATWLSNSSGGVLVCVLAGDREGGSLLVLTGRRILALPEVLPVTLLDLEPRACFLTGPT